MILSIMRHCGDSVVVIKTQRYPSSVYRMFMMCYITIYICRSKANLGTKKHMVAFASNLLSSISTGGSPIIALIYIWI